MENEGLKIIDLFSFIGEKLYQIASNKKFTDIVLGLNEMSINFKDKGHIEELIKYGWTMNTIIARHSDKNDYKELSKKILEEIKNEKSFFSYKNILESVMDDSDENKTLYKEIIKSIENENYKVCLPSLTVLIENNLRTLSNQWNSYSGGLKSYVKKQYKANKDITSLYSLSKYLEPFFNYIEFNTFRNNEDYDIPFNRNLSQHGVYNIDKVNSDEVFKLINVLFTIHQIRESLK